MIPPGFHFAPTDEELITYYLLRRAAGLSLPCDQLVDKILYGENANPWDVFNNVSDDSHWDTSYSGSDKVKKVVYVFTKLSKVNGKTRIVRTAGCGKWDGQTGGRKIYNGYGEEIGLTKMFSFQAKKSDSGNEDHWIMHEYSLSGISLRYYDLKYKDYVICKITRILSKEKFDREEEEKRRLIPLLDNIIMNFEEELMGKKRSLEEVARLEDQPSDHKKHKATSEPESTAVIVAPDINDPEIKDHGGINDDSFAWMLARDFNLDDHLGDAICDADYSLDDADFFNFGELLTSEVVPAAGFELDNF